MKFLGIEIGNVARSYKIEAGNAAPDVTLSASRSDKYLVLDGHPVLNTSISSATVTSEIANNGGPEGFIDSTKIKSILNGNTEVGECACIGYMLLKFTLTTVKMVTTKEKPTGKAARTTAWKEVQTQQTVGVSDYIVTTAYNVARKAPAKDYKVHKQDSGGAGGGQVHVEQICAHRLRAFLLHLKGFEQSPTFNFEHLTAEGYVKFRGKGKGGALSAACNGCEGVWKALRKDYPFLQGIVLTQD